MVTVLYSGGYMMSEAQMTVGDLTSFLLYTVYVGFSIAGKCSNFFYCQHFKLSPAVVLDYLISTIVCDFQNVFVFSVPCDLHMRKF